MYDNERYAHIAASTSAEITDTADTKYPVLYTSLIVRHCPRSHVCKDNNQNEIKHLYTYIKLCSSYNYICIFHTKWRIPLNKWKVAGSASKVFPANKIGKGRHQCCTVSMKHGIPPGINNVPKKHRKIYVDILNLSNMCLYFLLFYDYKTISWYYYCVCLRYN